MYLPYMPYWILAHKSLRSTHRPSPLHRPSSAKSCRKNFNQVRSPTHPVLMYHIFRHNSINNTLAGVAQLVERVALITAKRSTSRSWVRAPPSAIPISKLIRAAVLLLFGLNMTEMKVRHTKTCRCDLFDVAEGQRGWIGSRQRFLDDPL